MLRRKKRECLGRPVPHQIEPREDPCDGVAGESDGPIDPRLEPPVGKLPSPRLECHLPIITCRSDGHRLTDLSGLPRCARRTPPHPPPPQCRPPTHRSCRAPASRAPPRAAPPPATSLAGRASRGVAERRASSR